MDYREYKTSRPIFHRLVRWQILRHASELHVNQNRQSGVRRTEPITNLEPRRTTLPIHRMYTFRIRAVQYFVNVCLQYARRFMCMHVFYASLFGTSFVRETSRAGGKLHTTPLFLLERGDGVYLYSRRRSVWGCVNR